MEWSLSGESRIKPWSLAPDSPAVVKVPGMGENSTLLFVLMAGTAGMMALVYIPLRIFLTVTARGRRLRLLQRIRRLRDELAQPLET